MQKMFMPILLLGSSFSQYIAVCIVFSAHDLTIAAVQRKKHLRAIDFEQQSAVSRMMLQLLH